MKNVLIPAAGWYGVAAILASYALLNFGVLHSNDLVYIILNLTGSVGIFVDAFRDKDYQPVVLNVVWAAIAIVSLVRLIVG